MARRATTPKELRDAVERTVQSTLGSAQEAVDDVVKSAESGIKQSRKAMRERVGKAVDRRPATAEDLNELRAELRAIGRRLAAIEERLPAKRKRAPAKRSTAKRGGSKRSG